MEYCENYEDCRNKDSCKCDTCECNKNNYEKIEVEGYQGEVHDRKNKRFYIFSNHYDPL